MSAPLLIAMALMDTYVGIEQFRAGHMGMAMVWFAYAVSCLGFLIDLIWRK